MCTELIMVRVIVVKPKRNLHNELFILALALIPLGLILMVLFWHLLEVITSDTDINFKIFFIQFFVLLLSFALIAPFSLSFLSATLERVKKLVMYFLISISLIVLPFLLIGSSHIGWLGLAVMFYAIAKMRRVGITQIRKEEEFVKKFDVRNLKFEGLNVKKGSIFLGYVWHPRGGYYSGSEFSSAETSRYTLLYNSRILALPFDISPKYTGSILKSIRKALYDETPLSCFKAPAYSVVDGEFKDIIIAILDPIESNLNGVLNVESEYGDFAELRFEVKDKKLIGSVRFRKVRAKSVRVELIGWLSTRAAGAKVVILKTNKEFDEFRYPLSCEERTILVFHKERIEVPDIVYSLNLRGSVISGCGDGVYKLRLIIELPTKFVWKETKLKI